MADVNLKHSLARAAGTALDLTPAPASFTPGVDGI